MARQRRQKFAAKYEGRIAQALKDGKEALVEQLKTQRALNLAQVKVSEHNLTPKERIREQRAAARKFARDQAKAEAQEDEMQKRMERDKATDHGKHMPPPGHMKGPGHMHTPTPDDLPGSRFPGLQDPPGPKIVPGGPTPGSAMDRFQKRQEAARAGRDNLARARADGIPPRTEQHYTKTESALRANRHESKCRVSEQMSAHTIIVDGNFRFAAQNGGTSFRYPFADKGDGKSFIASRKVRQLASSYIAPTINSVMYFPQGAAYLVDFNAPEPVSDGQALLEWTEVYAAIPQVRTEYGSIVYTQQFLEISGVGEKSITEYTSTRNAAVVYEYSLNAPLPAVQAPALMSLANIIFSRGGWGTFLPGTIILAQDTTSEIWMGKIYSRKSVYVEYQAVINLS